MHQKGFPISGRHIVAQDNKIAPRFIEKRETLINDEANGQLHEWRCNRMQKAGKRASLSSLPWLTRGNEKTLVQYIVGEQNDDGGQLTSHTADNVPELVLIADVVGTWDSIN